jgi:signal transduction histidine kinase
VGDALEVEVEVDGRGARPARPSRPGPAAVPGAGPPGHGLAVMAERAAAVGGRLESGPKPTGGFRVHARLPLGEADP